MNFTARTFALLLPLRHLLVICCVAATQLPQLYAAEEKSSNAGTNNTVSRVWKVPSDLMERGAAEHKPEQPPDDPFASDEATPHPPSLVPPPLPPGQKLYDRLIPAMGTFPPVDARPLFESLGVVFRDGDLALFSRRRSLLFVRAGADQMDLVATIMSGGEDQPKSVEVTVTVRRVLPDQSTEDLIKRTLTCRGGRRAKFERHSAGKLMEQEEIELTVGEDGWTIDLNTALEYHFEGRVIKASAQALLRSGDAAGHVLYTARDKPRGSRLEVVAAAAIIRLQGEFTDLEKLAQTIDSQIRIRPATPVPGRRGDLYYVPYLPPYTIPDGPPAAIPGAAPSCMGPDAILDVRDQLKSLKLPLAGDDVALYSRSSALLFLRAGEDAHSMIARVAEHGESSVKQADLSLISWKDQPGEAAPFFFSPRSLLVRGGQKSTASIQYPRGMTEKLEIEASLSGDCAVADLNLSLTSIRMGRETWTLTTPALVPTDGESRITLVSGMAKDTDGKMKHLTVSTRLRYNQWLETVLDPKRKQAAIAEIEAALKK